MKSLGSLRTPIHEFFDLGSLTSIREQIDMERGDKDMATRIGQAAYQFDLPKPSAAETERINAVFCHAADGWNESVLDQVAVFVNWTRKIALMQGVKDEPAIQSLQLLRRAQAYLEEGTFGASVTDQRLQMMDRAGTALWDWFSGLEAAGITHMGELVALSEQEAFERYYPEAYRDVEQVVRASVNMALNKEGIRFNYWKDEYGVRRFAPLLPLPDKPERR